MACPLRTNPNHKQLSKDFGIKMADTLTRAYTRSKGASEFVYPTTQDAVRFLKEERAKAIENVGKILAENPYVHADIIAKALKPVIATLGGTHWVKTGDLEHAAENGRKLTLLNYYTLPNEETVNELAEAYPFAIQVEVAPGEHNTIVKITDGQDRLIQDDQEIEDQSEEMFWRSMMIEAEDIDKAKSRTIANVMGQKLSEAFNMGYNIVSEAQAIELLMNSKTPYNGQGAFFYNNKVYFVEGNFNLQNVLHEYSHPLIKGIAQDNPKLFENLYASLQNTDEGKAIIAKVTALYPNLKPDGPRFKEEVLVHSLEKKSYADVAKQTQTEEGFQAFMKKLLFAIRQLLRKLAGKKVNLSKLNENTTLEELANMMVNENFVIENLDLQMSDYAEFNESLENILNQLKGNKDSLQDVVNESYAQALSALAELRKAPWRLKEELKNDEQALINIRKILRQHQSVEQLEDEVLSTKEKKDPKDLTPEEMARAIEIEQEELTQRALGFVSSIAELKTFTNAIESKLKAMKKAGTHLTHTGASKVMWYQQFLRSQADFLDSIRDTLDANADNPLSTKILNIAGTVNDAMRTSKKLVEEVVLEFFVKGTDVMSNAVETKLQDRLGAILGKQGYSQKEIDTFIEKIKENRKENWTLEDAFPKQIPGKIANLVKGEVDEYYAKRLAREDIQAYLDGEKGDLGFATAMLVPYTNIDDPIAGGLARFVKTTLSDVESKSYRKYNDILNKILPQLEAIGYNPTSTQQLADILLFTDKIGAQNEDGTFNEDGFEVLTFLNEFKGYRFERAKLDHALEKAKADQNQEEIRKALAAIWEFEDRYMNRPMVDEYYEVKGMWNTANTVYHPTTGQPMTVSKEVSQDAYIERRTVLDKMRNWGNTNLHDNDNIYEISEYEAAQAEFAQLYSEYLPNGDLKEGEELERVLVRKAHRERSSKFYTYDSNMEKVQADFDYFMQNYLPSINVSLEENPERYQEEMMKFIQKNFRVGYTDEYYAERNRIFTELNALNAKYASTNPVAAELASLFEKRANIVRSVKDRATRIPNGIRLTENQREALIETEKRIVDLQEEFDQMTGLSRQESSILKDYQRKIRKKETLSAEETEEYNRLFNKSMIQGMSASDQAKFREILSDLGNISDKQATDEYITAFEYEVTAIAANDPGVVDSVVLQQAVMPDTMISKANADSYINNEDVMAQLKKSPKFKKWFEQHHYKRDVWNGKEVTSKWFRSAAWSITRPSDPQHVKVTELTNPITGETVRINGVPNSRYTKATVKEEYLTIKPSVDRSEYIGKVIDNNGKFLPRSLEDMQERSKKYPQKYDSENPYDKFINKEYLELKAKGGAEFQLLENLKQAMLEIQHKKPAGSKLFYDLPRFRQSSNLELIQTGKTQQDIKDLYGTIRENAKSILKRKEDDAERFFNYNPINNLVTTDLNGHPIERVPVRGLYRMKKQEVSRDVLGSMFKYLYSINQQEALKEVQPIAESIRQVMSDPKNAVKDLNTASANVYKKSGLHQLIATGGKNRQQAIDHYIDKVIYGKMTGNFEDANPVATKVANLMMKNASRAFIMLDIPSALKNRWGMMLQSMIEASGGKYISAKSLAEGRIWSAKTTAELTTKAIYSRGPKSKDIQLTEIFDPITGKTKKDFGKSSSRTFIKDFFDMTWMYDTRRLMDFEAGLQIFGGMMHHKYIDQIQDSGKTQPIKYIDAWELNEEKQLVLKKGIDPTWGNQHVEHVFIEGDTWESLAKQYYVPVEELKKRNKTIKLAELAPGDTITIASSEMFNDFKLKVQGVGKKLNGQMDDFDAPQANKYLGYRLFSFYKRYAVPMFLNRFQMDTSKGNIGGHVYDWEMGDLTKGYYITGLQAMKKVLLTGQSYLPLMTQEEKIALKKMAAEGIMLAMLGLVVGLLFGYDPGDEDRFDKMRRREEEYGIAGWMANHLLYQAIMVQMENSAFIPIPGVGMSDWLEYAGDTTIAVGPTLGNYAKIINDLRLMAFGDEKAVYSQDAGPYVWQKEGNYKLWNHLFSLFGIKGKTYDPITAVKKSEIFENSKFQ